MSLTARRTKLKRDCSKASTRSSTSTPTAEKRTRGALDPSSCLVTALCTLFGHTADGRPKFDHRLVVRKAGGPCRILRICPSAKKFRLLNSVPGANRNPYHHAIP